MRSVKRHEVCTTTLACSCNELQLELNLSWVFVLAVIFSSGSGTELKLLRLMFMCACCSQDFYLEVIVSFSLITKELARCLHWIMWSICCSYQSKSGEQFHPASPAPHVILSMPGSEFSRSSQLLQLQNVFVNMCRPVKWNLKNSQPWTCRRKIIQQAPVEWIRRVKPLQTIRKWSGKKKGWQY